MNCALKDLATQLLALLAVAALLATAMGPMLDHHYAERHPAHGHMYLGAAGPDHSHPFEHSHVHYDAMYAPAPVDGGVAYFASHDGSGHARADIAVAAQLAAPCFAHGGDMPLLKGGDVTAALHGVSHSPLLQPPRA